MKKYFKWVGITISVPILLFIIFTLLLYLPPVQNWVVKKVASYASSSTGLDISVDHVNLEFPLDLGIDGVKVIQQNDSLPQVKDTVADIGKVVADVQLMPLFQKKVMVDQLDFMKMKVNTTNFIHEARVKGVVGHLALKAHGIDLGKEHIKVDDASLADAKISVELSDTVPPDTTPKTNFWKVNIDKLNIQRTDFTLHMPGDTLKVNAYLGKMVAQNGYLDLYKNLYSVGKIDWTGGRLCYDNNFMVHSKGLDPNHIMLDNLTMIAKKFYYCDSKIKIDLKKCKFREKSGVRIDNLAGFFYMDSTKVVLPHLYLKTPESNLLASVNMDLNTFDDKNPGKISATLHGSFGKQDLMYFMGSVPIELRKGWPNYPLSIDGSMKGNMNRVDISGLTVKLPSAFNIRVSGFAENPMNIDKLTADINLNAHTYNIGFLTSLLPTSVKKNIRVPNGIGLKGNVKVNGHRYAADVIASEGGGEMNAKGNIDISKMRYQAEVKARNLQIQHFVPNMGLHPFTGYIKANGVGTDILSPRISLHAVAKVEKFRYGKYDLSKVNAVASISGGKIHANIDSRNALVNGNITLDALTNTKVIRATVATDLKKADIYHLNLVDHPLTTSLCAHVDLATDRKDYFLLQGFLSDVSIYGKDSVYRPDDVVLDILSKRDTTHAIVDCADFHLNLTASDGYKHLLNYGSSLMNEMQRQYNARKINQMALRHKLPNANLYLSTGKDNFIIEILEKYGFTFKDADIDMHSSPIAGLNGTIAIDSLVASKVVVDTIRLKFISSAEEMNYEGLIKNRLENTPTFTAKLNGQLSESGTKLLANIYDSSGKLGLRLPVSADMKDNGIRIGLYGKDPVLGYKEFSVNDDNYIMLNDSGRVSADMKLTAADGQGIQIYSDDNANSDELQNITLGLNKFDLQKVLSVIPYAPKISGIMDGDFHVVQTKENLSVSSTLNIKNMVYDDCKMGNVGSEFVYVPKSDGTHQVNGVLMSNGTEVATVDGTYRSEGAGYLDAAVHMERTPLDYVNGFVPEQIVGLQGYGEGDLSVKGPLSKPLVNGEVYLDSSYLVSVPYGVKMRFANDPVTIKDSKLLFENFEMFANNDQPLNISGDFDFSDLDRMKLNVKMRTENFEIIDAKENARSEAYGKAFVNFYGVMKGPVSSLQMRGKLDVLGSTDMTYVLRESELTTDNQLDELVKFTDLKDSATVSVKKPKIEGLDMLLGLSVDESAHILCALNADHSNYIDLMGGGNLTMTYNPSTSLQLTGRYTLNNGQMKYSLPVIPLKTFTIQDGSYIEFTGNPFNPTLSITATEAVKAAVNEEGSNSRSVDFVCGVQLSKTLTKPGILFIIQAPNDMTVQDQLNTMSVEQQSKIAITMLASGMYLADGNTSSFSMNSALSSFLNSEINNIAGSAMRTMGVNMGMSIDNSTTSSGNTHTDYNFKFSKRLWNNRLNVIIGGQLSTGADDMDKKNTNDTFFDNVELQYRIDNYSSKYLRLFYNNNTYDWLEGKIGEYGAGFMWKRKLRHFKDIFRFNSDKVVMPTMRSDSTQNGKQKK